MIDDETEQSGENERSEWNITNFYGCIMNCALNSWTVDLKITVLARNNVD